MNGILYEGGPPQNQNYLLEGRRLVAQDSLTRWVFQERVHSASANLFLKTCNAFVRFMMGDLQAHLPTLCWVFSIFWPKSPPYLAPSDSLCFPTWKRSSKENVLQCGRGETHTAEALKRIRNNKFKNCFEQWKKCLHRCIASNGEYSEGDWSLNM